MKVYDFFLFYNELDLLEIRLHTLNNVVDKFVLIESPTTFMGKDKPLHFQLNKDRYSQFLDKIIYVQGPPARHPMIWANEWFSRNIGGVALQSIDPEAVILLSDVDEIPKWDTLCESLNHIDTPVTFNQIYNFYKFNLQCFTIEKWPGTIATKRKFIDYPTQEIHKWFSKDFGLQKLREGRNQYPKIENGGNHYSYCMDVPDMQDKIRAFCHAPDLDTPERNTPEHINKCITKGESIWVESDGNRLRKMELHEGNTPKYILDNLSKFKHLLVSLTPE